ncbi:ABC transporter permease [Kribbella sp. NPDC023855]|uniref:ABC transporter permease n=1 Tax=Kribbella sp. NPDC023855 TaxID=3154698 RepID=UPI0033CF88B6
MRSALAVEFTKLVHATLVRATTVLTALGIALICAVMLVASGTKDPQLAAKLGPLVDPGGWAGYLASAAQVTAAADLIGCGMMLSWLFGREFADGTITGLFALPVSRPVIAAAKLCVYLAWVVFTSTALLCALLVCGLAGGLGPIPADVLDAIGRQFALTILTGLVAAPVAWAATVGRSVLAGVGTTIGILVLAQLMVVAGAGPWFPFSTPALWAVTGGADVSLPQLALVLPIVLISTWLALHAWRRLQLDR